MPTYVYKFIETGETIEVQQSFSDDSLTEAVHPDTGVTMPVKKVFTPVGVTFKGGGFYKTDSRGGSSKSSTAATSDSSSAAASNGSNGTTGSGDSSSSSSSSSSTPSTSSTPKPATPAPSTSSSSAAAS